MRVCPVRACAASFRTRHKKAEADNRWTDQGAPTLYLASDVAVVIAEFGPHFEQNRAPALGRVLAARTVYRLDVTIDRTLDLRDPRLWQALSLQNAPHCFLDKSIARATADRP